MHTHTPFCGFQPGNGLKAYTDRFPWHEYRFRMKQGDIVYVINLIWKLRAKAVECSFVQICRI